jgi:VCBS repeat-containing protein
VTQTVTVTPVDDAPVVTAGGTVGYTEQVGAVVLAGGLTLADADSTMLTGATVTITNFVAGDTLAVVTNGNITVTSNGNGVLVLSGTDTLANYQAVLRQITFANASNNDPTVGGTQLSRTISWSVTDDTHVTNVAATSTVAVTAVNDAPTEIVPLGIRGLPGAAVIITGVSFSDLDHGGGTEQATFSAASGTFAATTGFGVTIDSSVPHVIKLTGTISDLNAFIASGGVTFTPVSGATSTDISVAINDLGNTGGSAQSSAIAHLIITGNTPPTAPADTNGGANAVQEGAASGTLVGITAASTDPDGDPLTYSLVGRGSAAFQINATTGVVSVGDASLIDYESNPSHTTTITVQASDGQGGVITTDFVINVTDRAPSVPVDSNGATGGSVSEGAVNGATVGITASSSDVNGGAVTYSLGDDAGGRFTIDPATGVVTVANASLLDYESATSHQITVVASDGTLTSSQDFTIALTNVAPTAPTDADGVSGGSVSEGAVNGATVGIHAASTDIHGGTVTYSLTDDANGRFAINSSTGVVTVLDASRLDYETATSHSITVRASDPSGDHTETTFTIAITNVAPSTPVDGNAVSDSISEGAVNGDAVGITATSTDIHGGTVTYSLLDDAGGRFAIDPSTGVVTVASAALLDYETATSHSITVQAADPSGLATVTTFTIAVTNVPPSQPVDADAAVNVVVEGAANGTVVGITASSADVHGGTVRYALSSDSSNGGFAVDAVTGAVTVVDASKVDFESSGGSYTIKIKALDPSLAFTEQTFTIAVTDVKPDAVAESFVTDEDTPLVVAATQGLVANDSDINGATLTAVLVSGPAHGTLTLNADGSFSYLANRDYNGTDSFVYRASDGTLLSDAVTVSLTVNAVNDAPVLIAGSTMTFDANTGLPVLLGAGIALHDVDSTTMTGARVAITGGFEPADDVLGFTGRNGIAGSFDRSTGVLTLTGVASVADYQTVLASVTFMSTTQSNGARTVQWTVNDGSAQFSESVAAQTALGVSGIIVPPHTFADNRPLSSGQTATPVGLTFDTGRSGEFVPSGGDRVVDAGIGYGYFAVQIDPVLSTASDYNVQINVALASLVAPLGGDVAYVIARQANGDPLPDWLKFDPITGTLAGLPPDGMVASIERRGASDNDSDIATSSLPLDPSAGLGPSPVAPAGKTITVEVLARDSRGNVAATVFTIELRPRAGKQGWDTDWNVVPNGTRHAGLPEVSPELAAIEAAVRDATGTVEPFTIRGLSLRQGDAIMLGAREAPPAGRAGLSEQMAAIGWRAMNAQTNALLASLQQGR